MIVFLILLAIIVALALNLVFARKITNKTYKFFMELGNFILSLAFVILFIAIGFIKNNLDSMIDFEIAKLEKKVDAVYPGALQLQMNTEEIKKILEESLEKSQEGGIEELAENIVKGKIEKYTLTTLKTINKLERTENKLSVKDALVSIKELSLNTVLPYFWIAKVLLFIVYGLLIIVSIILSNFLKKEELSNKGIVFGEEADKTFIGMENK